MRKTAWRPSDSPQHCFVLVSVGQIALAQKESVTKGPPPRFISVQKVDRTKGHVIFDVQAVEVSPFEQLTLVVYPDGYQRLTLTGKPSSAYLSPGFRLSFKKMAWRGIDGKPLDTTMVVKQLEPGMKVLLSADGEEVEQAYLRMFKAGTLVLIVPVNELPVQYVNVGGGQRHSS